MPHFPLDQADPLSTPAAGVSLVALANAVLRHRRLVVAISIVAAALVSTLGLLKPRDWTAHASFMPQSRSVGSAAAGLAAQFGLAVPGSEAGMSPAFYADLVEMDVVLDALSDSSFALDRRGGRPVTLYEAFKIKPDAPALRREALLRKLRGAIDAVVVQKTGVVNLSVRAPSATLAASIATRLLAEVNRFNLERRKSQASAERQFAERRVSEAAGELRDAENRLELFLDRNREFRNSAALTFQYDRLQREVSARQQLHASLLQSYEQAKIDEVRDTPVITVVDPPREPPRPDSRKLAVRGLVALIAGALLGCVIAFVRDRFSRLPVDDDEYREFMELRRDAVYDAARPWRLLGLAARKNGTN